MKRRRPSFIAFVLGVVFLSGTIAGCTKEEKKADPDAAKKEQQKLIEERNKEPWPK